MPKLLPPTVGERLSECGTQVEVWGIVPGADVTLEVGGVPQTVQVNASAHTFIVGPLPKNVKVRAMQRVAPDQSDFGNVAQAEAVSLPPGPPATEPSLPGCGQCIFAWGVAPGSKIQILQGANVIGAEGIASRAGQACMTVKQPLPTSYDTQTITCGTVSPGKGHITINPPPAEVPPPKIVDPVFECQSVIGFQQLLPGAIYEIFVTDRNGIQSSLGTFCACTANMTVNVPRNFVKGDKVKAIGSMENDRWQCHVRGRMSGEVGVVPPDDRIKPVIDDPVWEGDPVIIVTNQIEGGTITLMRKVNAQATQDENLGSRPSSKQPEVPPGTTLHAGNIIWVVQELCGVVKSSDQVTVKGLPPDLQPVRIRKPVFACAEIVIVDKVEPGATVWVRQVLKPPAAPGPEILLGKKKSKGSTLAVEVFPRPSQGHEVLAYQEISGKFSPPSGHVEVEFREDIPQPVVIPPVRIGDTEIWCDNLLVGAHVRLFNKQMIGLTQVSVQIGSGTARDTMDAIPVWGTVPQFARVSASQMLCREGRASEPEVLVSSSQPCDGPPQYNPGKWNDGGFHEDSNNCYNYACDEQNDDFAQPGGSGGTNKSECQCTVITPRVFSDGLLPCTHGQCHPCHHKIALVMAPGQDFHFYRQDANGMWSHKPGHTPVRNVDQSNNPISNPETADRGMYSEFCGYFCAYKPKVSI